MSAAAALEKPPHRFRLARCQHARAGMGTLKELQYLSLVSKVTAGACYCLCAVHASSSLP